MKSFSEDFQRSVDAYTARLLGSSDRFEGRSIGADVISSDAPKEGRADISEQEGEFIAVFFPVVSVS